MVEDILFGRGSQTLLPYLLALQAETKERRLVYARACAAKTSMSFPVPARPSKRRWKRPPGNGGGNCAGSRAFSDQFSSYPELAKKFAHSSGGKNSMASAMATQRSSTVRAAAFLSKALSLAKACSIGLKSGE